MPKAIQPNTTSTAKRAGRLPGGVIDRRLAPKQLYRIGTVQIRQEHFFDGTIRPDCYAARITGNCCSPVLNHGDAALVSPTEEPRVGDFVVLFAADGSMPLIKRLLIAPRVPIGSEFAPGGNVASALIVETLNPPRLIGIRASTLSRMHRVVGVARKEQDAQTAQVPTVKRIRRRSLHQMDAVL